MSIRLIACIWFFGAAVLGTAQEASLTPSQETIFRKAVRATQEDAKQIIDEILALPPEERFSDRRLIFLMGRVPLAEAVDGVGAKALPFMRAFAHVRGPAKCESARGDWLPQKSDLLMQGLTAEQIAGEIEGADGVGRSFLLLALARRMDELPTAILPTLVAEMSRKESNRAAADVFARFGERAVPVAPALLDALAKYEPTYEGGAPYSDDNRLGPFAVALGNIGPGCIPALATVSKKGERSARVDASKLFAYVRSDERAEEATQALRAALEDEEIEVVREAIKELGVRRSATAADRLFVLLAQEDRVMREAAWALASIGGSDVIDRLCRAMADSDDEERRAVVAGALSQTKESTAVAALIAEIERDPSAASASVAATSLGVTGDPAAIDPLRRALRRSEAPTLQSAAAAATARYGKVAERSVPDLVAASERANDATKVQIALALEAVCDDRSIAIRLYKSVLKPLEAPIVEHRQNTVVPSFAITATDRLVVLARDDQEVERLILELVEAEAERGRGARLYRLFSATKALDSPKGRELLQRCADDECLSDVIRGYARSMAKN